MSVFSIGFKIIGAIIFYLVGRWLISLAIRLVTSALEKQRVDPTLLRYIGTVISVTLNVILVVAILGYFGVETTSFAALFAAAGVAIGLAWSGLLANFAAGAFMIVLRPFKVGDFVTAAGVTGTVKEIGLFVTALVTPDNVLTMLGNSKIFSDTIQNFSANPFRRVDLKAQLAHSVDHNEAIRLLKERVGKVAQYQDRPCAGRRAARIQLQRAGTRRTSLLPHRSLLAGLFRYQQSHPRNLRRRRLSRAGTTFRCAQSNVTRTTRRLWRWTNSISPRRYEARQVRS